MTVKYMKFKYLAEGSLIKFQIFLTFFVLFVITGLFEQFLIFTIILVTFSNSEVKLCHIKD